jgi:RNA polymerase sigma-70 factor, ECF subfamily
LDDARLIAAFLAERSEEAFFRLYAAHAAGMYALAVRLLGNGDRGRAEDAVQEAWVRAITRLPTFRGDSALRTWLCGIVVNCCRELMRGPTFVEETDPTGTAGPPETQIDVERALRSLPGGYRAVLVLHDIEGHTHDEIAGLLGIEAGTSKSQLSRARAALRRMLGEPEVGDGRGGV